MADGAVRAQKRQNRLPLAAPARYTARMRSIAILNQKGGVGKTTTAVNLSAALAHAGNPVLLVDLDPQSHASLHLGIELDDEPSVYDIMVRGVPVGDAACGVADNLVVIPANIDLVGAEIELAGYEQRETVLARAIQPYQAGFDYCIIDCAPSLGLLTVNALATVHEIIIPLQPHFLALQGLGRLLETIALVRQSLNPNLRVSGIVLCMYERATRLAQEVRDDVLRFLENADPEAPWYGARVFSTAIRRNIKLAECPSFGQTVFTYAPDSNGACDYAALAREVANGNASPTNADSGTVVASNERPAKDVLPADESSLPPAPVTAEAPITEGTRVS